MIPAPPSTTHRKSSQSPGMLLVRYMFAWHHMFAWRPAHVYLWPTALCLLPIAHCLLHTTYYCLLPIAHGLLLPMANIFLQHLQNPPDLGHASLTSSSAEESLPSLPCSSASPEPWCRPVLDVARFCASGGAGWQISPSP